MNKHYPKREDLWTGAILGGIVNATRTAKNPSYASFQRWIQNHYVLNGWDGREGVVSFEFGHSSRGGRLVGVFFSPHSRHRPECLGSEQNLKRLFCGIPTFQRSLAEQAALRYLRLENRGEIDPRVTAVFWDEGESLVGADPWEELLVNGVDLIRMELLGSSEDAFRAWEESYQLTAEELGFARALFEQKMMHPDTVIELSEPQLEWLKSLSPDRKAIENSLDLFSTLGILSR